MSEKKPRIFLQVTLSKEQKEHVIRIAKDNFKTASEFCREAIFEKIRRIEHPEQFGHLNASSMNLAVFEQIQHDTKKMIELQEETNKRLEMARDIENTRQTIKELYKTLKKKDLIGDHSKDADEIANILSSHKSLTPHKISIKLNLDVDIIILILQTDERFKLNITTGRYELR